MSGHDELDAKDSKKAPSPWIFAVPAAIFLGGVAVLAASDSFSRTGYALVIFAATLLLTALTLSVCVARFARALEFESPYATILVGRVLLATAVVAGVLMVIGALDGSSLFDSARDELLSSAPGVVANVNNSTAVNVSG